METQKETYEQAMKRLEEIVVKMEHNELDIDSLGEQLKEAKRLIEVCRNKLYKTEDEIKQMLEEE